MDALRAIRSSLFDPAFYRQIRTLPLWRAIAPFALFAIVAMAILMLIVYVSILPFAKGGFLDAAESAYPPGLIVTIAGGEMSINQPQPYYVKNTLPILAGKDAPENLVIFDGNDELGTDLASSSAFVIVKKNFLISQGSGGQAQITSFSNIRATTSVDRAFIAGMIEHVRPYVGPAIIFGGGFLGIVLALFLAMFWTMGHLIYALIPALLIFFIGKVRKMNLDFSQSYRVTLLASIPPAILFFLLSLAKITIPIPFAYTLALLLIAGMNLTSHSPVAASASDTSPS